MFKRHALLIGINYFATPSARLNGCVNDVERMRTMLLQKGWQDHEITVVTDEPILSESIIQPVSASWFGSCIKTVNVIGSAAIKTSSIAIIHHLNVLKAQSWDEQLNQCIFYYSGHGGSIKGNILAKLIAVPGGDMDDNEALMPSDSLLGGMLSATSLLGIFKDFWRGTQITCIFDACNSGNGLRLPLVYNGKENHKNPFAKPYINLGNICLLAGCADDETSDDTSEIINSEKKYGGAFTFALLKSLENFSTVHDVFTDLSNHLKGHKQHPQLESSYDVHVNDLLIN